MTQPEVLKLTNRVWFEQYPGCVMTLEYIERQSDPYYTDNQESVDIDSDLAKRIVAFLAKVPQVERRVHSAEHHVRLLYVRMEPGHEAVAHRDGSSSGGLGQGEVRWRQ
jgi:hypothetical protein